MKKLTKTSELLWVLGIIFVAFGVAICSKANLGVSMIAAPTFIIQEAIVTLWSGFTVGVTEYLVQALALIIMCILVRRADWRYLLAFASAVAYGYMLDLAILIVGDTAAASPILCWIYLLLGDCFVAAGVACFFRTYMPLQVYELFVAEVSARFGWKLHTVKSRFDLSMLVLSLCLTLVLFGDAGSFNWMTLGYSSFHSIGLGTLVTTFINAPLISFFGKILDKLTEPTAIFPKLKKVLARK